MPLRLFAQILEIIRPDAHHKGKPDRVDASGSRLSLAQADTIRKASVHLEEWRKMIIVSERKRFKQTILDLYLTIHATASLRCTDC
jgi:hypothetical protein